MNLAAMPSFPGPTRRRWNHLNVSTMKMYVCVCARERGRIINKEGKLSLKRTLNFCVKDWDVNYFLKTGLFPFLTIPQLKEEAAKTADKLAKVFYAGMGFMMVRKGAFEKVTYPWFEPIMHEIEMSRDFSSEDVSLCWKWAEKNVGIYIDPEIVVGHEKSIVIR